MNLKLEKKEDRYDLYDESTGQKIASDLMQGNGVKLSTNNCEAVFNGYDLDELVEDNFQGLRNCIEDKDISEFYINLVKTVVTEIIGDKRFSLNDLISFGEFCNGYAEHTYNRHSEEILEEWLSENSVNKLDVEIVTEKSEQSGDNIWQNPKLDDNGCIILRRK